jgi:DNA-directed RNA polymerase subunit RPC12/RpoP
MNPEDYDESFTEEYINKYVKKHDKLFKELTRTPRIDEVTKVYYCPKCKKTLEKDELLHDDKLNTNRCVYCNSKIQYHFEMQPQNGQRFK